MNANKNAEYFHTAKIQPKEVIKRSYLITYYFSTFIKTFGVSMLLTNVKSIEMLPLEYFLSSIDKQTYFQIP